jgi:membrane peptidoglycan carboxypeptidase
MLISEELEQKFTKQQIFEFYANWVPPDNGDRSPSAGSPKPHEPISTKT